MLWCPADENPCFGGRKSWYLTFHEFLEDALSDFLFFCVDRSSGASRTMAADASSFPGPGPGTKSTPSSPADVGTTPADGGDCCWDCGGMSPDVSPVAASASNEWWWKEESPVSFRFSFRNWSDRVENFSDLDIPPSPPEPVSSDSRRCRGSDVVQPPEHCRRWRSGSNPPRGLSAHAQLSTGCFRCSLSQSPMTTCQTRITFPTNRRSDENPSGAPQRTLSVSGEFYSAAVVCMRQPPPPPTGSHL